MRNGEVRGYPEKLITRTIGNIRSDIDVSCGDNAVEWRPQELKRFEGIQSIDIGFVGGYCGLVFAIGVGCRVAGLCIKNLLLKKQLITFVSYLRQLQR